MHAMTEPQPTNASTPAAARPVAPRRWPLVVASTVTVGLVGMVAIVNVVGRRATGGPPPVPEQVAGHPVDLAYGQQLYTQNCSSCHGREGQGMPQQGSELVHSTFVMRTGDAQLLRFLQVGRQPDDPQSVMRRLMPPRGGNAALEDDELADLVGYLRQMQATPPQMNPVGARAAAGY